MIRRSRSLRSTTLQRWTGQARVFKFSLDGQRLTGLKREVTVARLLEQDIADALGKVAK